MKKMWLLTVLAIGISAGTFVWAEHHEAKKEAGWFDAEACEFCKLVLAYPELMASMRWETHKIENGMLMVVTVPQSQRKIFEVLWAKMHKKEEQIAASGESVDLCGCCESFGRLKEAGAKDQEIKTALGRILLVTARDPAVVNMIHKHVDRTVAEEKKMAEAKKRAEGMN